MLMIKQSLKKHSRILKAAKAKHRKYIFNLSHGVMPDVNPLEVKIRLVRIEVTSNLNGYSTC